MPHDQIHIVQFDPENPSRYPAAPSLLHLSILDYAVEKGRPITFADQAPFSTAELHRREAIRQHEAA